MSIAKSTEGASASTREASLLLEQAPKSKRKPEDQQVAAAANAALAGALPPMQAPSAPIYIPRPTDVFTATGYLSNIFTTPIMKRPCDKFKGDIVAFNRFEFRSGMLFIIFNLNHFFGSLPKTRTACTFCYYNLEEFNFLPGPLKEGDISTEDLAIRCHYEVNDSTDAIRTFHLFVGFKKPFAFPRGVECRFLTSHSCKNPKPLERQCWQNNFNILSLYNMMK
jgi:hypothetical protein